MKRKKRRVIVVFWLRDDDDDDDDGASLSLILTIDTTINREYNAKFTVISQP